MGTRGGGEERIIEGIKETPAIRNPILLNTTVGPFITVTLEKRPPCKK